MSPARYARSAEGPDRVLSWTVHSERSARRFCEAKGHVKERSGTPIRAEHPHEVIERTEELATRRLPDGGIQHRGLLRCDRRICDPEFPEHLPDRFAQARYQPAGIARWDQDGEERPLTHAGQAADG